MVPQFFKNQFEFRKWLAKNHKTKTELLVGFYKVDSGIPSMTWPESVDQALCFGWIDSVRRSIDAKSYSIRFTPRKSSSIWSDVNIAKVDKLLKAGLMQKAGIEKFELRKEHKSRIYAFENELQKLSPEFEKEFKSNKKAWTFFNSQAPSYKKVILHRIMTAKRKETQLSRLRNVICESEKHKRIP